MAAGVGADGDIVGTLSVLAFTFTMVTGGNDTITGMLGGSMPLLHQRPEQRRLLVDDLGLIPHAVEELLRLTSPVQGLARTTTRDVTIGDTPSPPVAKCYCCMVRPTETSANMVRTPANSTSPAAPATS